MKDISEILKSKGLSEVFFGPFGFHIANEGNIDELQLGYSIHPDGSDLTGEDEGGWQKTWVVIGYDTELGDPFFVDVSDLNFPVYTAMHGVGAWVESLVATSLKSFLEAISRIQEAFDQKFSLIEPNDSAITDSVVINKLKESVCKISGAPDYWERLFAYHQSWAQESGS